MKYIVLISLFFLLISCDPSVDCKRIITNNSNQDIWLINLDTAFCNTFDSILVVRNTSYVLDVDHDIGGSLRQYEDCQYYPIAYCMDSLGTSIATDSSLSLSFPLTLDANWIYQVIKPGKNGSCECRLNITDADLQ